MIPSKMCTVRVVLSHHCMHLCDMPFACLAMDLQCTYECTSVDDDALIQNIRQIVALVQTCKTA
jgi:hypothetical protein